MSSVSAYAENLCHIHKGCQLSAGPRRQPWDQNKQSIAQSALKSSSRLARRINVLIKELRKQVLSVQFVDWREIKEVVRYWGTIKEVGQVPVESCHCKD